MTSNTTEDIKTQAWPWSEFPEDASTWQECVAQFAKLETKIEQLRKEKAEVWEQAARAIQTVQPELAGELTHYEKQQWREWNQQATDALRTKQESK